MSSRKAKRKAEDPAAATNHVPFRNTSVKRLHYTVTSDAGSSTTAAVLGRLPIIPSPLPLPPTQPEISTSDKTPPTKSITQVRFRAVRAAARLIPVRRMLNFWMISRDILKFWGSSCWNTRQMISLVRRVNAGERT